MGKQIEVLEYQPEALARLRENILAAVNGAAAVIDGNGELSVGKTSPVKRLEHRHAAQ